MDLNEISVFAKVVQAGSFTGAARALHLPKSTVSAKVQSLERRLGIALLHRTTRKLHLTTDGESFYDACKKSLAELEAAEANAQSKSQALQGVLRVTAPFDLGVRFMPGFLAGFSPRYPGLEIDLVLTGRVIDLIEEGMDVAFRATTLKDSTMVAKKVVKDAFQLFAAPGYLDRAGRPCDPRDLSSHRCIRHSRTTDGTWTLMKGKSSVTIPVSGPVQADELSAVKEFVQAGMGIGLFPQFIAADGLRAGLLEAVLPDWSWRQGTLFITYPAQRHLHPKVRVFVDEAYAALKSYFGVI